jgi:hypothetical protein
MTRIDAITRLFAGVIRMERGNEIPFPIPEAALTLLHEYTKDGIQGDKEVYIKFVCAALLGKFDDQFKDWV